MSAMTHLKPVTRALLRSGILFSGLLAGTQIAIANSDPDYQNPRMGGATTVKQSDRNAFSRPAANLSPMRQLDFKVGNSFFKAPWVMAPASTTARDGLGPLFNTNACQNCHVKDGRGLVPVINHDMAAGTEAAVSLFLRLSRPAKTDEEKQQQATYGPLNDPTYGGQLQNFATTRITPEGEMRLTYSARMVKYPDGTETELRVPHYEPINLAYGPAADELEISPRIAPQMIGLGLLELLKEDEILAHADPDDKDGNGISGRPNLVWDPLTESTQLGRFGWKAGQPGLKQQNAGAFAGDMGLTSSLSVNTDCTEAQPCHLSADGGTPEVTDKTLDHVTFYTQHLAVPAQRNHKDPDVKAGYRLFNQVGCQQCHTESWVTGVAEDRPELSGQHIRPFTDMLLHDMGEDLADNRPEFLADGQEWRTAPLWGVSLNKVVTGQENYLHDGRARTLEEAILWHGGESEQVKQNFMQLSADERQQMIRFLESI